MTTREELAGKLIKAWRYFFDRGFVDGFGHISCRAPEAGYFLVSRHSLGSHAVPEDFVLVDLDGRQVDTSAMLPGELPIHLEIYRRRPDVGSVAHFHTMFATSFSVSDRQLRPTYFPAAIFRAGIPIHPDPRLVNSRERGVALAETLGEHRAALMKAHGVVVTGRDIEEMFASVFILEDNAHRTWLAASMGKIEYLSDDCLLEIEQEILTSRGPLRRIWALCEEHADTSNRSDAGSTS